MTGSDLDEAAQPRTSARTRRAHKPRPPLGVLEARIGHSFADQSLLTRALTHTSKAAGRGGSYQRLEFLGDRVLGLAVADRLYAAFPEADEGDLSRRLAALVRRETCAMVAAAWDVGPHLILGQGEVMGGGRRNQTILADVCEAILGAIYLDAGFDAARAVVEAHFHPSEPPAASRGRDAKSALQEWAMGRSLPIPTYEVVERTGPDHAPKFRIAVRVEGLAPGLGEGTSKRIAEQAAAQALMEREGIGALPAAGPTETA
ncbi:MULTISPECIES: ribonuclease III [unclassified Methylobacterium]|uniref:ribonuclease III n=1 Tax=unclassified Methylobacterium TaxID=2615210 RepID=UPI00135436DE|nr:ribonuclease III [Methylobacterium sp. 2A]MWV22248.1 ribonuclease III [Methylobacterium sp. 2A]